MKVKFANKIYEVLCSKEVAGKTIYAVEDEPNHVDWLVNVEVVDTEEELEDEKVRKEIIKLVKFYYGQTLALKHTVSRDKMLAWLEKQDFNYTFEIKEGHWYKCVCDYMLNNSDVMFKYGRLYYCRRNWRLDGEIDEINVKDIGVNGYKSFFRPATNQEIKDWLEKQEEQKINDIDFKAKDWYVSKVDGKIHNASKIKPEFKVNDWITFYGDQSFKIIKIEAETNGVLNYLLLNQNGHCSYYGKKYVDENARLWTIEDAKEGDVLAIDWKYADDASKWQEIVIFKSLNENGVEGWGGTFKKNKNFALVSNNDFPYYSKTWSKYLKPSSKEQCKILFKMLREKGYEWNADKKELVEL